MLRSYLRNILFHLPAALAAATSRLGMNGARLAFATFVTKRVFFPIPVNAKLTLRTWAEAVNYLDNFVLDELRFPAAEEWLELQSGEVIEVGVNVGITSRWWLAMGENIRVVGIDMMKEALDYTTARVSESQEAARWQGIEGAVGDESGSVNLSFNDPLEGTNSLNQNAGARHRQVEMNTLDAYLLRASLTQPLLLKIDIEGHGAAALRGATETLEKVRWVVLETHGTDELQQSASLLGERGFTLQHFHGRTMWWRREEHVSGEVPLTLSSTSQPFSHP